jgi:predicted nicotinamide N-methyase
MPLSAPDLAAFIRANLPLAPVPAVPEVVLHTVTPASGLRILSADDPDAPPPYWAYQWAGGTVLARYVLDHPEVVAGLRVLDLGAGSGLVAIAAARAGARAVTAAEIDPHGLAALALNADANVVAVAAIEEDLLDSPSPEADLIAVSDLFYADDLAQRVLPFLDRCLAAGVAILIGDPYRKPLPLSRLELVAEYDVPDFGSRVPVRSGVFSLRAP